MARKRKLDAAPLGADEVTETEAPIGAMGGMWAGSAMNLLKQRIEETQGSIAQGILAGTVVLELRSDQIIDAAGSDRIGEWETDDAFAALVQNMERRGQTQPVRVRPVDPNWHPSTETPLQTDDQFIVQSGRRRIAACAKLGKPVLAILSTDTGDAKLADLEERFHENTMRKNLTGFEELLSIGLLAQSLKDLSQSEIATRLGVSQNDVSLGLSCLELRDEIIGRADVAKLPKRAFRELIPQLRRGSKEVSAEVKAKPKLKRGKALREGISVEVKETATGLTVKATSERLGAVDPVTLADELARLLVAQLRR